MGHETDDLAKLEKELLLVYQTTPPSIRVKKQDSQLALTLSFEKKRKYWFGYEPYVTILVRYMLIIVTTKEELRDVTFTFSNEALTHEDSTRAIVSKFFPKDKIN